MVAPQMPGGLAVLDLFCGAGGMSWGFHAHAPAFVLSGAVDLEVGKSGKRTYCNDTYERNLGLRPLSADLSTLDPAAYRASLGMKRGELGVLISCAPCTGFSQKNASNHVRDDPRNHLVERSAEFVRELEPEFFVMENVKELIQGNQSHHFQTLRKRLVDMGYAVSWGIHDLAEHGVPQHRVRALVLARRDGGHVSQPPPAGPLRTVRMAIGHLPKLKAGATDPRDPMHTCPSMTDHSMERVRAVPKDGGSWTDIPAEKAHLLIPSMRRKDRRAGSFPDIYGRLAWDRPAITITRECAHPGNGRYLHPEQHRLLSVREMALLQGFPEDFQFLGPTVAKYNQIGDAVPPHFSAQVARHVLDLKAGTSKGPRQSSIGAYA